MKRKIIVLIVICSTIIYSCINHSNKNDDDAFYTHYVVEDYLRLPLLKPYEVINVSGPWSLDLIYDKKRYTESRIDGVINEYGLSSAYGVNRVNVFKDSTIELLVIGNKEVKRLKNSDTLFFFIDVRKKVENFFLSKDSMTAFWVKNKYDTTGKNVTYDVDSLYKVARKSKNLPWREKK